MCPTMNLRACDSLMLVCRARAVNDDGTATHLLHTSPSSIVTVTPLFLFSPCAELVIKHDGQEVEAISIPDGNENLEIDCIMIPHFPPGLLSSVHWLPGNRNTSWTMDNSSFQLKFQRVHLTDAGDYKCEVLGDSNRFERKIEIKGVCVCVCVCVCVYALMTTACMLCELFVSLNYFGSERGEGRSCQWLEA